MITEAEKYGYEINKKVCPKFTIIDINGMMQEYVIDPVKTPKLMLGRSPECEIQVANSGISGVHGKFKWANGGMYYADMGSTNGTYINKPNDIRYEKGSKNYVMLQDGDFLSIRSSQEGAQNWFVLLYTQWDDDTQWTKVDIGAEKLSIGRAPENDIVVQHVSASRQHAEIYRYGEHYVVRDLGSLNGVRVNGNLIRKPVKLKDNDVVTVLNTRIIFRNGFVYYRTKQNGVSLSVRNVNKTIKGGRKILNNVNLDIGSNEFVAIIGGSGAGKSTVMNAISGFDREITGTVLCDGLDMHKNFSTLKNIIGYVPQEDIIYNNLTLRKMLYYTAKLKMPKDISTKEIDARIAKVLDMVELSEHQNTFIRKLSGGQKKRASIAVEMLADPGLFFLDEPTSGLDPGTEKNLMQTLNRLAKLQGKTIIMVTHTTQNLHLCDKVIFMGTGGKVCFCGSVEDAKAYFGTQDLVDIYGMIQKDADFWALEWNKLCSQNGGLEVSKQDTVDENKTIENDKSAGAFRQFAVLTSRYATIIRNDWQRLLLAIMQPIIFSIFIKLVCSSETFTFFEDTQSALFAFSCGGIWIGLFNAIQEICKERPILRREYMCNLKLVSYVASKFFVQSIMTLAQALLYTALFFLLVGNVKNGLFLNHSFPEEFLLMWLTMLASVALGFAISAAVRNVDKAMVLAPYVLIVQLLFSGVLFDLGTGVKSYVSYATICKWTAQGYGSIADLNKMDLKVSDQEVKTNFQKINKIANELEKNSTDMKKGISDLNSGIATFEEGSSSLSNISSQLSDASKKLNKTTKNMPGMGAFAESTKSVSDSANVVVDSADKLGERANKITKESKSLSENLDSASESLADLAKETANKTKTQKVGEMIKKKDLHKPQAIYAHTKKHLSHAYIALLLMTVACFFFCTIVLRSLSRDRR